MMDVYQWMVKYTPQTEWIEKRGIFLWIAFYAGGLSGGLYLVSLYFNNLWGMLISWLIMTFIKGGSHLLFLGKPWRFWRIITRPQSSWLARGFIFVILFIGSCAIQMAFTYWMPGSVWEILFKVSSALLAFGVMIYTGIILKNMKGVPFWNSILLPILFVLCGVLGGFGLAVAIGLAGGGIDLNAAEWGSRIFLIANVLIIVIYLFQAEHREDVGRQSVMEQLRGNSAPIFWGGIVALGIVIPLVISFTSLFMGEVSSWVIIFGVVCEIIGGLSLRYCVLKSGAYKPLVAKPQNK